MQFFCIVGRGGGAGGAWRGEFVLYKLLKPYQKMQGFPMIYLSPSINFVIQQSISKHPSDKRTPKSQIIVRLG
jgi:hypothetical protein